MALRVVEDWKAFFDEAGIPSAEATAAAEKCVQEKLTEQDLQDLTQDLLKELDISAIGHRLKVIRRANQLTNNTMSNSSPNSMRDKVAAPKINPPQQLTIGMSKARLEKFANDWEGFKQLTKMSSDTTVLYLYNFTL